MRIPGGNLHDQIEAAAGAIRAALPGADEARVAVVLGSGLGPFAGELEGMRYLPYGDIPSFPPPPAGAGEHVAGHAMRLAFGTVGGAPVIAMQGRFHYYEGYALSEVVFPVRVLAQLGARVLVVTNAAGGIGRDHEPGDLMAIEDHLNLMGVHPLRGPNDERIGPRFPDMSAAYPQALRDVLRAAAAELGIPLKSGVYAAMPGPSYETPAEIRMLAALGADAVGMSTVPEVIAANHMGMHVCGISCISNKAAGLVAGKKLSHAEVIATGERVREAFIALLRRAVPRLAALATPAAG